MTPFIFSKFKKYIYFPDFANKFLINAIENIPSFKQYKINFEYIFRTTNSLSRTPLQAFMNIESIYPKRCSSTSKVIILRYSKAKCHSVVRLSLTLDEFLSFYPYFPKKPLNMDKAFKIYIKANKYFFFPGFISRLQFPRWKYKVLLSLRSIKQDSKKMFMIHKSAFID